MKPLLLKSMFLTAVVIGGLGLTACEKPTRAHDPAEPNRTAGQEIDDKSLASTVKAALQADSVKYPDVQVNVYKGVVQLSGFADTRDQKSRAADVAEKVANVKKVENNITVKEAKNP